MSPCLQPAQSIALIQIKVLRLRGTLASRETEWDVMTDLYFYRDPEAEENKDSAGVDEAKVPGADEVGPAAVESGFSNEWEVSGANTSAFAAASNTASAPANANWDADAGDWAQGGQAAQTGTAGWDTEKTAAPEPTSTW